MPVVESAPGLVTRVQRIWLLPPFKKALDRRRREQTLLDGLTECIDRLFRDPTSPGLNLETVATQGRHAILTARINRAYRLVATPVAKAELGLLYFDNHNEAYRWIDRHREQVPTLLTPIVEVARGTPIQASLVPTPAVRRAEEDPLALTAADQWRQMVEQGIERYLAYLDDEQRRIAELNASGLLLVKGAAGTGKTAVAIQRALLQAQQPRLDGLGSSRVLFLCFNHALMTAVEQTIAGITPGGRPETLEVRTIHSWCLSFLTARDADFKVDPDAVRQRTRREFGRLSQDERAALAGLDGDDVFDEIEQVIKANLLASADEYLRFNRRGRGVPLKQPAREAIWNVFERVTAWQHEAKLLTWNDVPARALVAVEAAEEPPAYHAIVVDEGQDLSPAMARLARRLVGREGQLTVLADPAQQIYASGFQWTQRELKTRGGNTRWLRTSYRTTREIHDLARPLIEGDPELVEELRQSNPPVRRGPRPTALACADVAELHRELASRVASDAAQRPPNQIGVIVPRNRDLDDIGRALGAHGVPHQLCRRGDGGIRLTERSVKLLTMHSAKGLDFPVVYVLAPMARDGARAADDDGDLRRLLYVALTRSSDRLTLAVPYGQHHPLVSTLDPASFDVAGSRGQAFALTAGPS